MAAAEGRNVRRTAAVLLLAAFSIALWAPDLRRAFGHPLGYFGIATSPELRIVSVTPGSPAARANIRPGPYLDLKRMAPQDAIDAALDGQTADAGQREQIWLRDANRSYSVTLTSVAEDPRDIPTVLLRGVLALVLLFAGMVVVLRKPSVATWAFFVFSLAGGAAVNVSGLVGPPWFRAVMNVAFQLQFYSAFAAAIFALYLLQDRPISGWRRTTLWAVIAAAVAYTALVCWQIVGLFNGNPPAVLTLASVAVGVLSSVSVPVILIATYLAGAPAVRERLRWVIAGFILFGVARCIDGIGFSNLTPFRLPYYTHALLIAISALAVSLTVIYAVLKHRVIDVNVAFSRAVVYTVLSAFIVGVFALVDLFFSRALSHSNAGYIADIALALILGFFFNTMHHQVDCVVDGLLFRSRHLAERHLAAILAAIPYAKSEDHVTELITKEPARTLDLSGALLARTEHMNFSGAASLISCLEGTRTALRPAEHGWQFNAPIGFEPALAAPILSHGDLIAVAFYGFHANHTDLDQDEIALLERIASTAGAAYDHLEAQALRREVEVLRAQVIALGAPEQALPSTRV